MHGFVVGNIFHIVDDGCDAPNNAWAIFRLPHTNSVRASDIRIYRLRIDDKGGRVFRDRRCAENGKAKIAEQHDVMKWQV